MAQPNLRRYAIALFGDGASVVKGAIDVYQGANLVWEGLQAGPTGCVLSFGGACAPSLAISAAAVAGGALRATQGAFSAAAGIENIVEAVFAVSAGGSSGGSNQPLPGDPVREVEGAIWDKPRGGGGRPQDIAYAARVTNNDTGLAVYVDRPPNVPGPRVEFDGFEVVDEDLTLLLDAKNWSRNEMFDFSPTSTESPFMISLGKEKVLAQAQRQVMALPQSSAGGIEWRMADETVANSVREFLLDNGYGQIRVVYTP